MLGGADGVEREYLLCGPAGGDWERWNSAESARLKWPSHADPGGHRGREAVALQALLSEWRAGGG